MPSLIVTKENDQENTYKNYYSKKGVVFNESSIVLFMKVMLIISVVGILIFSVQSWIWFYIRNLSYNHIYEKYKIYYILLLVRSLNQWLLTSLLIEFFVNNSQFAVFRRILLICFIVNVIIGYPTLFSIMYCEHKFGYFETKMTFFQCCNGKAFLCIPTFPLPTWLDFPNSRSLPVPFPTSRKFPQIFHLAERFA